MDNQNLFNNQNIIFDRHNGFASQNGFANHNLNFIVNSELSTNYFFVFVLGMLAWYASMAPAIAAEKRDNVIYTDWHSMITYVPFLYGLINVIVFYVLNEYFPSFANYFFVGIVMGLFYSGLGRITGHANMYKLSNNNLLHVYAIIMYVTLYGIVFNWLDSVIC